MKEDHSGSGLRGYVRFGAMILTAMMTMYILTYVNTYERAHVTWSETRAYMTLVMGAWMAVIMLAFMWGMHRNLKVNAAIIVGAVALFTLGTFLVRSQTTVQERSYMSAMIPHHSIAILTSEHSEIEDVRVCKLAVGIIDAQRREIAEMKWLIDDIDENGPATTVDAAQERAVPDFAGGSVRTCP